MSSRVSHDAASNNYKAKSVTFGGPGYNKQFDVIRKDCQRTYKQPFFHKGKTVLSEWNRYGTVFKAFKENGKVIVMVKYYAKDIPSTWEIGGIHVPSLPRHIGPNSIIVIGQDSRKLKLIKY